MLVSMAISMPVSVAAIMAAFATAFSVVAMTSPVQAGFLYVPPSLAAEAAAAAGEESRQPAARQRSMHAPNDRASGREHEVSGAPLERLDRIHANRAVAERLHKSEPAGRWRVRAGETLREALGRWGGRAGVEVLFLTDRRYRLHEGRAFGGSFDRAARTLFAALSHLPHSPVGEMRPDGRTLAVMHKSDRSRTAGVGR